MKTSALPEILKDAELPADGVLVHAEWELVHDSPFQYRRTMIQANLEELKTNIIETGGIHQPILARRRFPNPLRQPFAWDPADGFEIVAGHRRKAAGMLAGLLRGPLLVKDFTDAQARKVQLTENVQREDVHPMEEAEGFQELIKHHGETANSLAKTLGKSRGHVYGRIKLLQACTQIRKACLAGEIGTEVTLLIARLRTDKLQERALGYIKGKYISLGDGGAQSLRGIRLLLKEKFTLDLKGALFDPTDAQLLPLAGDCTTCTKRTGNAPEFEDLVEDDDKDWRGRRRGSADLCTDPDCFDAKKKAHLKNKATELESKGKVVIDGNRARNIISADGILKPAYIALKDVKDQLKKVAADAKPQVVVIQDPRFGKTVEAIKREDLTAAGVKVAEPKATTRQGYDWKEEQRKADEERARNVAAATAEAPVRLALLAKVREAAAASTRSTFDLQMIAHVAFAGVEYNDRRILADLYGGGNRDDVHKIIGSMDAADVALFALTCALVQDVFTHSGNHKNRPKPLAAAAAHYGIDEAAIRAGLQAPAHAGSPPPPAARAPRKAKAGAGTKIDPTAALAPEDATAAVAANKPKAAPAPKRAKAKAKVLNAGDPDAPYDAGLVDEVKDKAGSAGERDPNTSDMFEEQKDDAGVAGGSDADAGAQMSAEAA